DRASSPSSKPDRVPWPSRTTAALSSKARYSYRSPMSSVRVGEVLAGRFRIERLLGEGGMGVVLLAHHLHLDQPVAIKLLSSRMDWSEDTLSRFMREARAASKIKSEQVVRVFDVASLDDGSPYIV